MLASLAYIFLLGFSLGHIFNKLRLPSLLGMILTGILLGPYVLNLIAPQLLGISLELRQIALVIILTRAGLALDIASLRKVGRPAILMCFVPACFEIAAFLLIAPPLLGVSLLEAGIIGTVIAAVSPAVIVPKMLHLMENKIGTEKSIPQMIMAGGSVDDVFVIVLFTALTTLAQGGEVTASEFAQVPISIASGLLLGISVGWMACRFFKAFHLRDSIKLLLLLSLSFLLLETEKWLKGTLPLSGLLAIMAMGGSILRFYPLLAKRISPKYGKLWVGAEVLLFVLVGATVDIHYAAHAGIATLFVLFFALVWRMVGVYVCMLRTTLSQKERLFCMIAYLPKATVQAAIGSIPLGLGLPCGKLVLTLAVIAILVTAPLGAFGIDLSYRRLLLSSSDKCKGGESL